MGSDSFAVPEARQICRASGTSHVRRNVIPRLKPWATRLPPLRGWYRIHCYVPLERQCSSASVRSKSSRMATYPTALLSAQARIAPEIHFTRSTGANRTADLLMSALYRSWRRYSMTPFNSCIPVRERRSATQTGGHKAGHRQLFSFPVEHALAIGVYLRLKDDDVKGELACR